MPKRKQTEQPKSEQAESGLARSQKFEYREIARSQIEIAQYNPRKLSEYARKQLETSLKKFGLVEPLVWNETTERLVSGHQRMAIIDKQQSYPGNDYRIGVAVVALDDKREKQLNVWLNNRAAQGNFDEDLMQELLTGSELSLDDIGFTKVDWELEFGKRPEFAGLFQKQEDEATGIKSSIEAIKERKKVAKSDDNRSAENDADYYLMVCFNSASEKESWLRQHGFPGDSRFMQAAEMFMAVTGAMDAQGEVIQQAINRVRELENDPNMKSARCLELVSADYLAGMGA